MLPVENVKVVCFLDRIAIEAPLAFRDLFGNAINMRLGYGPVVPVRLKQLGRHRRRHHHGLEVVLFLHGLFLEVAQLYYFVRHFL